VGRKDLCDVVPGRSGEKESVDFSLDSFLRNKGRGATKRRGGRGGRYLLGPVCGGGRRMKKISTKKQPTRGSDSRKKNQPHR